VVAEGKITVVGGTSVSAPGWAGLFALVNQARKSRQGLANPEIYRLGNSQLAGKGDAVYHDITMGDTGFNGIKGETAGIGYDLASGWGSFDATLFVTNYGENIPANFSVAAREIDFGTLTVGEMSSMRTITITNTTSQPLQLKTILLDDEAAGFSIVLPDLPQDIAPGNNISFNVNFKPNRAGKLMAMVGVVNGLPDSSPLVISLRGMALPAITNQPPRVMLTSPRGGESLAVGNNFNITWQAEDDVEIISQSLMLSLNGGMSYDIPIVNGLAGSLRNFSFNLPGEFISTQARVRIIVVDNESNEALSQSASNFTIADKNSPNVKVESPEMGKIIPAGGQSNIVWMASDNVGIAFQEILLSSDGGKTFTEKLTGRLNGDLRRLSFIAPARAIAEARVRVLVNDGAGNGGAADSGTFTIAPQLSGGRFAGQSLFITGAGFEGKLEVMINERLISKKRITERSTQSITLQGKRTQLNLRKGNNVIEVRVNGVVSASKLNITVD
jgi:hypothetical protein